MATQERDPRAYELMTVFVPDLSDEDTQTQVDKVATYISNAGGSVNETLTSSPWGRRRLAYTIRFNGVDYRDGVYTVYHFDSAPSNLTELERDLKLDTSTIRYLLVHDDPKAGEKFPAGEGEEGAEGETEGASAAGEAASASAVAATTEATEAEAAEPQASAETTDADTAAEPAEAEAAPAESSEESAPESAASSEAESSDDTTETNEDESSDKE